ncbi:NAD(P)H-dependent glycerol-3-phosphate dehydrogenase [Pelagovum pacificum]|uniref:Glycerol-3-phosphate dehydrogenase [NAD(P)+] n=1 Tax=Pelagovum pacificum TaxID=2588711 RepID=A0A5C5GIZ5_9RHOB|nr:NAD(P)H-dependent glycerol-3-phosphate dehydrogenase [Pelagovum pacificum]QQA42742.1 NAD(P)-dependent glycerol-3-phosphate dehydrogenase [Pelagovum pacificum]TNY34107.1 NAD(P)-dependent glycerol-3-phosphate dehydrogenase [Pelagovum pacificum]
MIVVAGGGAFGTALAVSLAANGPVGLWMRSPEAAEMAGRIRENTKRLPGVALPENIAVSADIDTVFEAETVLLALPAQQLRSFLEQFGERLSGKTLVACAKGIDVETMAGPVTLLERMVPDATSAMLTGPSFAADIARGLPTALTIACRDDEAGVRLQHALTTPSLRFYRTTDTRGAELGGALKNVVAIASGACIGKGYGDSARAALMTRGFAEMQRLAAFFEAEPQTLMGLSGFGDLTLTCTSELSRNYRFGLAWGRHEDFDKSLTVEGVHTALAVARLAEKEQIDMPITRLVADVVNGVLDVDDALQQLLSRPLKEE